jgi:hypothetical protein
VPDRPFLVGVGHLEDRFLASGPPSDLETNGQALGAEPAGHRDCWSAGEINGVGRMNGRREAVSLLDNTRSS